MNMGFDWKGFNFTMQWVGSKNVNRMYDIEYRIPYTNAGKRGLLTYFYDGCWTPENQLGVLKNAMMPVITFLGMMIAEILAGSIVVEQVFALPGIGRLLISSVGTRDLPVVEILILYITFVVIFVYFIVDILYRVIDPRIRKSE